jgi:hypothetical protein
LFEIFLAIPQFISKNLFGVFIPHLYLLPLNWMLSSFSIIVLLKVLKRFFPLTKRQEILVVLPVLFNYNFIDTAVHLYRDISMIFFMLLFIYNMIENHNKRMLLCGVIVFFIRGANGILLLILYGLYFFIVRKNYSLKKIILVSIVPIMVIFYFSDTINSSFFRGGFGIENTSNLQERIINRLESNQTEGTGGSMMLRRGNFLMKALYPSVYTFSPFIIKTDRNDITVAHADESNIHGYIVGTYKFPPIYKLPSYIHTVSICLFMIMILYGIGLSFRTNQIQFKMLAFFMVIQILTISIISMQARHRLPIIFLFPVFYSIAYNHIKGTKLRLYIIIASFSFFILLFLSNIYLSLSL